MTLALGRLAILAAILSIWEFVSGRFINQLFISKPSRIAVTFWDWLIDGSLAYHAAITATEAFAGFLIGAALGMATGVVLGRAKRLADLLNPFITAFYSLPKIALAPLFIIWFGIGEGSKIATLGFGVFFPTVINTAAGVDAVPRGLVRMGQAFGLSRAAIVWRILLPGAMPAILSGFRVTSSIAIILLVAAEMIGAERGIGAFVLQAGNLYDTDNLLAGIVVLSLLGLTVAWLLGTLERVLLRWR